MSEIPQLLSVRPIDSATIYDPLGARIGRIERLMLDPLHGRVQYVVASFSLDGIAAEVFNDCSRAGEGRS